MKASGTKFLIHAHAQLMPNFLIMDSLQKVFTEFTYLDTPPLALKYFAPLDGQLDKFKLLQAITPKLVADAQKTDNQVLGDSKVEMAIDYLKTQTLIFPDYLLFTSKISRRFLKARCFKTRVVIWYGILTTNSVKTQRSVSKVRTSAEV